MTERDDEKALVRLAERVRAGGVPPPEGACPDEATLLAYRAETLDDGAEANVDRHLARCASCLLALRALAPAEAGEVERLARVTREAATRGAADGRRGGLLGWLADQLSGWSGRAALAGAAAAVVALVVVGLQDEVGPEYAVPAYELEWVRVSAERGAGEETVATPVIPVARPDAVLHAQFGLTGKLPEAQALHAVALVRAPDAAHLRPAEVLALRFTSARKLELRLQAEKTFRSGPGRYVLWIAIGTPESRPHPLALSKLPLEEAQNRLLDGADAGKWSLQRLEIRYQVE